MDRFRHVIFPGQDELNRTAGSEVRQSARLSGTRSSLGALPVAPTPNELRFVREVIAKAGVEPLSYRVEPLRRRLSACYRALRVSDVESARGLLEQHPSLWNIAINALLIGVTKFYRDRDVFDQLRSCWIPSSLATRTGLRVWSVGASDGAELYSVAAMLCEQNALSHSFLRGSDCRESAIESAKRARYGVASLTDLPEPLRAYFQAEGPLFAAGTALREAMIDWRVEDALSCAEVSSWDLILCRNMAIYLESRAQAELWSRLTAALKPGGLLVVGKAERPGSSELRRVGGCVYSRISD